VNEHGAAKSRLVWTLPVIFGLSTMFLWLWSVAEHRVQMQTALWTDNTTIPLVLAGGLNAPVATFAYPMYDLLYPDTSRLKRLGLFLGVILLWGYVGWTWDQRRQCRTVAARSRVVSILGVSFGIFTVCASIPMYHVGIIYKAAACIWAFSICRHFTRYWKGPSLSR